MPPTLTEQEEAILRGSKKLLDELLQSPKTKRDTEALIKALHPDTVTQDDLAEPYVKQIKGVEDKLDKFIGELRTRDIDDQLGQKFRELESQGYTADGIEKIKQVMVDRKIPNPLDAAAVWEKQNPPKTEPPTSLLPPSSWGEGWGIASDKDSLKLLMTNEDAWAEQEARKAWDEETRNR